VIVNDTAFVHGGLPPMTGVTDLDALNARIGTSARRYLELRRALAGQGLLPPYDMQNDLERARAALDDDANGGDLLALVALGDADVLGPAGPLWYRGSVYCKPILEGPVLDAALGRLRVARVVVGHTPTQTRRVHALHGGKVVMLDTGMLVDYYAGRPAALIIDDGADTVQYLMPERREAVDTGDRLLVAGLSRDGLVRALESGTISAVDGGFRRVTLQADGHALEARFIPDPTAAALELSAFALDELLGTALVPPTVERRVDGETGALQIVFPDALTEAERIAERRGVGTWCPMPPQYELMYAFDLLVANAGRSVDNIAYREDLSDLLLLDHARAFGPSRQLPSGIDESVIRIGSPLRAALARLDEDTLDARLGRWLDQRARRALLARRDRLLERF
jgi:hypothetical protein